MNPDHWSVLVRCARLVMAGAVLVAALSARGPAAPSNAPAPALAAGAGGGAGLIAQTLSSLAASESSGPYVVIAPAFAYDGVLSRLPPAATRAGARPEPAEADQGQPGPAGVADTAAQAPDLAAPPSASMPSPVQNFAGLAYDDDCTGGQCGIGVPPDTNGDVGPNNYIQTVNVSVGIFSRTGTRKAGFTFSSLFKAANTGTACDNGNNGDPVTLYDAQSGRFIVTDFAVTSALSLYYECLAVAKGPDPLTSGWWLYALPAALPGDPNTYGYLNDYPKLGVWSDGIYMSANMYDCHIDCGSSAIFVGPRVWALNRSELISGSLLHAVAFKVSPAYFTLLPSNYHGTLPPDGTPNYFASNDFGHRQLDIFKFHVVSWTPTISATFSGPTRLAVASYAAPPAISEPPGANNLDSLGTRLMMQNQYRRIGTAESLWLAHTAGTATPNVAGVRWYQVNVSSVSRLGITLVQQSTYRPDTDHRWMASLAVDKWGDMAVGYSVSSASRYPAIRFAGRLAGDPLNSLTHSETTLVAGDAGQAFYCGVSLCDRWGDYSSMTVDPTDDCTFWYTTEYYTSASSNWQTRIGAFRYPYCTTRLYLPNVINGGG